MSLSPTQSLLEQHQRSYRCHCLQARCANDAELLAAASVHGVVANVERIDDGVVSVDFEALAEVQA